MNGECIMHTLSVGSTSITIFFPLSSFTVSFILPLWLVRALLPPLLPLLLIDSPPAVVGGWWGLVW